MLYMQGIVKSSPFAAIYLITNIGLTILVFLKILDPYTISYSLYQTVFQLSFWRPFTALFYLSRINIIFPFQFAFACLASNKFSNKVNKQNSFADELWVTALSGIALPIFSTFSGLYFYGSSFVMIMLMMWAIQHPIDTITIMSRQIHSIYFPIIYPLIMIMLGSYYKQYLAGFLIGLLLGILKNPPFIARNKDYFPTPSFLKSLFVQDIYLAESRRNQQGRFQQRGYFQGQGYHLA